MLDEYLEGVVDRISPEAPVPVHLVTGSHKTAGGAANVARNIQLAANKLCAASANAEMDMSDASSFMAHDPAFCILIAPNMHWEFG